MGPGAVAILAGARPATRSADTHHPFRQESDFLYLTGFDHPHAAAVLSTAGGPGFTLYVEPRERDAEIWTGRRPGVEGAIADYGAEEAHPIATFLDAVAKRVEKAERLFVVLGRDPKLDARLTETIDSLRLRSRLGIVPPSEIIDPRSILHEMRLFKDPFEIDSMRRAAAITAEAHRAAAREAMAGRFEYELEATLDYEFRRRGASGPAYGTIVGGGANATILHYVTNRDALRAGDLVLIDAGCEFAGYASDVTRTYPIGGRYQGAGLEVYEAVLAAQEAALSVAKPGATLEDVHAAALRSLTEAMIAMGLLSGSVDDLIESGAYKTYYMHRTSHWLGLDVHDVGSYTQDGRPRTLEPGIVFTVEPGLYIAADDEKAPERLRGIGVRIEDDVLVTAEGHENLTAAIPKRPGDVEAWITS
jgi:Xaa-Pro aminopeptidase